MSKLRNNTVNHITTALEKSGYFKLADFSIGMAEGEELTELTIGYKYNPDLSFIVAIPEEREASGLFVMDVRHSPGELTMSETVVVQNLKELTAAISNWTGRLKGELLATPEMRKIQEQEQLISELTEGLSQVPNEFFSQEEAQAMRERLDTFEKQLASNLKEHTRHKVELAEKSKL